MVWKQKYNKQANNALESGWTAEEIDKIDPRDNALRELRKLVQDKKARGDKVMIMSDMNKDTYQIKRKSSHMAK